MSATRVTTTGFTTVRSKELPLLQATAHELEHATGARLIHFACADDVNTFAAVIPTVPVDETGAPHILEHCVLSGSKRYPDARSIGALRTTGGGAWTGWEYTWYNFSSPSHRDFLRLVDIRCDSLFEPLLSEETFQHQAHHLEFTDPEDPTTPLRIRGVIFNEQKGIIAHPIYVSWTEICRALFPGHPYALEHGGTPRSVPTIKWDQLKDFHARHYHPANARFLSWGDIALEELLATLDQALARVPERAFERPVFPPVRPLGAPVRHRAPFPIGAGEDPTGRGMALMAWATTPAGDAYEAFLHDVVDDVLMGTPTAPLRAALASSGLGRAVAETYDRYGIRHIKLVTAAGLQDCDPKSADDVAELIGATLTRLAREGLDGDAVDASLNRLEFRRRTLAAPRGGYGGPTSFFIQHVNTHWLAGGDPLAGADMEPLLERLAAERASGRPLERCLHDWYIENPHQALVVLEPDPDVGARVEKEERASLETITAQLTDEDKRRIVDVTRRLFTYQEERSAPPQAPSIDELEPPRVAEEPTRHRTADVEVEGYVTRTNGISYVDVFCDVGALGDELWDYLHLFSRVVVRAGSNGRNAGEMQALIDTVTGGLSAEVFVPVTREGDGHLRLLRIGGCALERRQEDLVAILSSLLRSATFTPDVLRAVIDDTLSRAEQRVFVGITDYLKALAGSSIRRSWALRERLESFSQLALLRGLATRSKTDLHDIAGKLEAIREHVSRCGALEVLIVASSRDAIDALRSDLAPSLSELAGGVSPAGPSEDTIAGAVAHAARTFGQPAAFNCEVYAVPSPPDHDAAAIRIGAALAARWVQMEVSRKGTAYHASCDAHSDGGSLVCWSIRDPNIERTYAAFDEALRRVKEGVIDDDEFGMARVGALMALDTPLPPPARARRAFLDSRLGFDAEARARYREALISLEPKHVARAAQTHLTGEGARATLASRDMIDRAMAEGIRFDAVSEI